MFRVMLVAILGLTLSPSRARAANDVARNPGMAAPADAFLRVDSHWLTGFAVYRRDQKVGPGFLALDLKDAVRGVPLAEQQADRATHYGIAALATGIASIGFFVASAAYSDSHSAADWPLLADSNPTQNLLNLGGLLALVAEVTLSRLMIEETAHSVNTYNYALVSTVQGGEDVD